MSNLKALIAAGVAAALVSGAAPVFAGPAETARLQTYVGDWSGAGTLTGGDQPEDFTCRMQIKKGTGPRINFAGRCSLINFNLPIRGTVLYNDDQRRYEGTMSTQGGYCGLAIGRLQGSNIVFDLTSTGPCATAGDEDKNMNVKSKITLGNDSVTVDFNVTFADSGDQMKTKVPFSRK